MLTNFKSRDPPATTDMLVWSPLGVVDLQSYLPSSVRIVEYVEGMRSVSVGRQVGLTGLTCRRPVGETRWSDQVDQVVLAGRPEARLVNPVGAGQRGSTTMGHLVHLLALIILLLPALRSIQKRKRTPTMFFVIDSFNKWSSCKESTKPPHTNEKKREIK